MKCYILDNELRLIGKAWEIKHHLKQMLKKAGTDDHLLPLSQTLACGAKQTGTRKNKPGQHGLLLLSQHKRA